MIAPQLLEYVRQQISAGISQEDISKTLIATGWQEADVQEAINSVMPQNSSAPLPTDAGLSVRRTTEIGSSQKLLPIGQLLASSFSLYKERFLSLFVLILIPCFFLGTGLLLLKSNGFVAGIACIIGVILLLPVSIGAVYVVSQNMSLSKSFLSGLRLFFPMLWMVILSAFISLGGNVMFIIPGILMVVWFSLISFTFVIEGKRGLNALLQSREYTRGHWWSLLGRILIWSIPLMLVSFILQMVLGKESGSTVFILMIVIFINPFLIAYNYKIYQNLVVLKPQLAATQATSGRWFFIVSGILGFLTPIIFVIFFVLVFLTMFSPSAHPLFHLLNQK